ncbi:hypothetical protein [Pseudovibrio sp. SPO723]|uniref:hypothetical protein n=1 Tax=Nesiotobacter zosterae TaxID=392721 RepID=UPI0029C5E29F|nr:hypothetical protein [Pseudovibrio sp. SPO723]MDX5594650.1 hypothetical protein [Pseudovibrio sp. SPO723]
MIKPIGAALLLLLSAAPSKALELPFCSPDDDLVPIPRWEVDADTQFLLSKVPPLQEGLIIHLLLSMREQDEAACEKLTGAKHFVFDYAKEDPQGEELVITVSEDPVFDARGCIWDGLYAFGEISEPEEDGSSIYRVSLHRQPDWTILDSGRFCKMVQEG